VEKKQKKKQKQLGKKTKKMWKKRKKMGEKSIITIHGNMWGSYSTSSRVLEYHLIYFLILLFNIIFIGD